MFMRPLSSRRNKCASREAGPRPGAAPTRAGAADRQHQETVKRGRQQLYRIYDDSTDKYCLARMHHVILHEHSVVSTVLKTCCNSIFIRSYEYSSIVLMLSQLNLSFRIYCSSKVGDYLRITFRNLYCPMSM